MPTAMAEPHSSVPTLSANSPTHRPKKVSDDSVSSYIAMFENHPVLTKAEEKDLRRKYRQGDEGARERLILSNLRFVVSEAARYAASARRALPLVDLISEGIIGLCVAVEKFEEDRETCFVTMAAPWIRRYILRANITARPIRLPDNVVYQIQRLSGLLSSDASAADLPEAELMKRCKARKKVIRAVKARSPSMQTLVFTSGCGVPSGSSSEQETPDPADKDSDMTSDHVVEGLCHRETMVKLTKALKGLGQRDRQIITKRYGIGGPPSTLEELASELSLSKERVRQIESRVLRRLAVGMMRATSK